jgi:hypothetical protein
MSILIDMIEWCYPNTPENIIKEQRKQWKTRMRQRIRLVDGNVCIAKILLPDASWIGYKEIQLDNNTFVVLDRKQYQQLVGIVRKHLPSLNELEMWNKEKD